MIEQRSSSFGDIVGSCVETITRVPMWRWRRMVERRDSVKRAHSAVSVIYLCASSRATIRPIFASCSRNRLRQILKSAQAVSAVMHGQDKSMIVNDPDYVVQLINDFHHFEGRYSRGGSSRFL